MRELTRAVRRNELAAEVLGGAMTQIHGGVAAAVWTDIETRMPELAVLAEPAQ